MKMSKLRRKYEGQLKLARDEWRAHRVQITKAEAEKAATIERVRKIRDSHAPTLRQNPYGRAGSSRAVCVYCTTNAHPCPTWQTLNSLLDRLLGRS